ncbi:MAG: ATP-binding protein, partial [Casimicrobiaceae bacterium]
VGHLIQYLRAALPKMRENTSTIGQEVELVTAYLNVLKMRMGARLEFGIDVPTDLLSQPFPPMMLPSLVENAIKHGLEPLREGGRIDLIARRTADSSGRRIWLEVKDTGRGLTDSPDTRGGGVGLTNLRERLAALYGGAGRFKIESNDPRGVVAAIDIPADAAAMEGPGALSLEAGAAASPAEDVATGWRRAMRATSRTHSVWAWIATRIFLGLMTVLAVVFLIMLIALYTGWLPIDAVGLELGSLEGMAVGSIVLLVGFAVCALVIAIVAAVFYGLGFLLAVILLAIPLVILASLFPVLAPFIVIGLLIYWLWWRKQKRASPAQP